MASLTKALKMRARLASQGPIVGVQTRETAGVSIQVTAGDHEFMVLWGQNSCLRVSPPHPGTVLHTTTRKSEGISWYTSKKDKHTKGGALLGWGET